MSSIPHHAAGTREEFFQQLLLAAKLDFQDAVGDLVEVWAAACDDGVPRASVRDAEEFDVAVLRLAGSAIHHYVNARPKVRGYGFGMGAQEGEDEFTRYVVGHLFDAKDWSARSSRGVGGL